MKYSPDATALSGAYFGLGSGNIVLGNVMCSRGSGPIPIWRLVDCPSGMHSSCSHHEDAGVKCQGRFSTHDSILRVEHTM